MDELDGIPRMCQITQKRRFYLLSKNQPLLLHVDILWHFRWIHAFAAGGVLVVQSHAARLVRVDRLISRTHEIPRSERVEIASFIHRIPAFRSHH